MTINDYFGVLFIFIILSSSIGSVFSRNGVYAVLFLVTCFISSASLLFLYKCEFIPLIFILVYVGAIAVLFLFVIIMVDVKIKGVEKLKFTSLGFGIGCGFLVLSFINNFSYWFQTENPYYNSIKYNELQNWHDKVEFLLDIETIGRVLYSYYVPAFLTSGFLLFLAVLGSVSLTTNFRNKQISSL